MSTPDEPMGDSAVVSGWFSGPKAENGEWFANTIRRVIQDYHSWRRNYFPEDGVVVDSAARRHSDPFMDVFEDRLLELLARLKADCPFQSPRYAAHMVSEQTLPSIAGLFAALLYNPNNVSTEAAPVTVRLELEAAGLIARMLGYGPESWAHLTSGGTIANIEALWIARTTRYLPLVVRDMRRALDLPPPPWPDDARVMLGIAPSRALDAFAQCFTDAQAAHGVGEETTLRTIRAYLDSPCNVVERGLASVCETVRSDPVVLVPETHHYSVEKAMDVLGLGRRALVPVPVDTHFRLRVDELGRRIDETERSGRHILAVVGVVGTTEEGAIDPIHEVLDLRSAREAAGDSSFWLHADAAYGGYLRTVTIPERIGLGPPRTPVRLGGRLHDLDLALPERSACDALERLGECDSITVDPHKLGYIPYPSGAVCFRSSTVKPIVRQVAEYIAEAPADVNAERRSESVGPYILEGSKPGAAAAAVWLSHAVIPLDTSGHGILLRDTIRNACELHSLLEQFPRLAGPGTVEAVCLCPPGSNIVCYAFRPVRPGASLSFVNTLNRRVYGRFSLRPGERVYNQTFFVSRTTLSPRRYSVGTVSVLLDRLGVEAAEYQREGVFLLRSVLMNPWYARAKQRGRYFLSELVAELYSAAEAELAGAEPEEALGVAEAAGR